MQEATASALRKLACNDENLGTIASAGAIQGRVQLLGPHSSENVQVAAAGALRNLAHDGDNKDIISAAGAIPALV
ncbi:hypothetical protein FOA52_005353 [Chlamydomonas sp. UWO 241]|nr:hypothetical protein FOA52_005353 [Chlamydomonas sp. UWO 241]